MIGSTNVQIFSPIPWIEKKLFGKQFFTKGEKKKRQKRRDSDAIYIYKVLNQASQKKRITKADNKTRQKRRESDAIYIAKVLNQASQKRITKGDKRWGFLESF